MTKIRITLEVYDDYADPEHEMGITEEAYEEISTALSEFGDDVNIEKDEL